MSITTAELYKLAVDRILDAGVPRAAPETIVAVAAALIECMAITTLEDFEIRTIIEETDPAFAAIAKIIDDKDRAEFEADALADSRYAAGDETVTDDEDWNDDPFAEDKPIAPRPDDMPFAARFGLALGLYKGIEEDAPEDRGEPIAEEAESWAEVSPYATQEVSE
jgi:hypothetical protein